MPGDGVQTLNCHVTDIIRRWYLSADDKCFGARCDCDARGPTHWLLPCDVADTWLKCTPCLTVSLSQMEIS